MNSEVEPRAHTKLIGDRTTAMVLAKLLTVYDQVLIPFGENVRYDLVVDTGASFLRVQCKTGRVRKGAVQFATSSVMHHHQSIRRTGNYTRSYRGQADYFGVYCPETDKVYFVPVEEVGTKDARLRVETTKNAQERFIRWARDYELGSEPPPSLWDGSAREDLVAYEASSGRTPACRALGLG